MGWNEQRVAGEVEEFEGERERYLVKVAPFSTPQTYGIAGEIHRS
jgi:hypothetical protein